jgi:glucosamine-6-phosphate deaminase
MKHFTIDNLKVEIHETRQDLGREAAEQAASLIKHLLTEQDTVNIVFAAAPSQNEFLDALVATAGIDWSRVNAFHMDEYIGLPADHPQRFGSYLRNRFFNHVSLRSLHLLNEGGKDQYEEARRYADLISQYPIDITWMGIGENTHLAFNDPHVADFNDPERVKVVDIDDACKQQQVNDGCFPSLEDVPSFAYTLTIPALMSSKYIFCMVPAKSKATAIRHTLLDDISAKYPSTSLRKHPNARLYLDQDSASEYLKTQDAD